MVLNIKGKLLIIRNKEKAIRNGLMGQNIQDIGKMIKLLEKE